MSTVKINVTLRGRTDLALLVSDGQREAWVPLSQIEQVVEEPSHNWSGNQITAIVVPDWVAREKGLQQVNQDDTTIDMFGGAT